MILDFSRSNNIFCILLLYSDSTSGFSLVVVKMLQLQNIDKWRHKIYYRVFSKGRNEVGPSKSLIFWTFSDVLDFFWLFNMGDFSFWYFWVIWLKKKLKNLILQKG